MAQTTLPVELITSRLPRPAAVRRSHAAPRPESSDPTAFEIGLDYAHHHLTPPLAHLQAENPVHLGWRHGRQAYGPRTLRATAPVRRWLALRLDAWVNAQAFEAVQVTPHFLHRIEASQCPVTDQALSHSAGAPGEQITDRINTHAAYAAGNLVSLSRQAHQARQGQSCEQILARAQRLRSDPPSDGCNADPGAEPIPAIDDLDAHQWQRLAVLLSFATPLPHAVAATLPLVLMPPPRVRVINPVQALQVMLTLQFAHAGYARRLVALSALMPGSEVRQAFQVFMHTLLARRLSMPASDTAANTRRALQDVWQDALVQRRWQRLATRLTAAQCEHLLHSAAQRKLVAGACQWLAPDQATEGWSLDTRGQVQALMAPRNDIVGAEAAMPGSARKRDSQNVPSCAAVTNCGAFQ